MAIAFMVVTGIGVLSLVCYALGMTYFLGVVLPYAAILVFMAGFIWRIVCWARSPVPFPIALTGGQQKSLPWIKHAKFEAPASTLEVAGRMVLEVFLFRSLFRNTRAEMRDTPEGPRLIYWSSKWLWVFALLFHYAFLVIFIRHFRFFIEPVPICLQAVEFFDSIMAVGSPVLFQSDPVIVAALLFLFLRRLYDPKLRYISLLGDYFPLFLLLAVALSGISLRYWTKVDIASVKVLTMGLVTFSPTVPAGIGAAFYVHMAFVASLLIYFPFSKLMHAGGVLLSPTRNLAANSREFRHVNPWNGPKQYRTYAEYEDEFRDAMAEAGLPLEKEPEAAPAE
ncbi:Hdr-like menaquinol oxidoreductase cytochrome b-like subunit [uncultured delta proteobacterium]|uniref:Hdr-like menaquinol oxidoreductase cytochrome b-like subunit n=1 Tax=uncultured delta proteobacterium TaxID=34034 RepID=A0A212KEC1_9DELT|nr:Hdr-like menaquinol oxidoreductase cytochrome b-like subunit [uncultured delta proteobacterium]